MMASTSLHLFRNGRDRWCNSAVLVWTSAAWLASFLLMGQPRPLLALTGVLLAVHAMVLAAYLVHEAAHATLFRALGHNRRAGEWLAFMAGASYASFDRIRHMHLRHHRDRADLICFDYKGLLQRRPGLRRVLQCLEWAYIPAAEMLMHCQVIWRPFTDRDQFRHRPRVLAMLLLRGTLLLLLARWSLQAFWLYLLAYGVFLHVLNFFDAFHHTFDQFVVQAQEPVALGGRDRAYEQANTFSNLISVRWPWLNLLTLNFGYHNAHHECASVPWHRLPQLHRELYGELDRAVMPLGSLLRTWHANRVARVGAEHYGTGGGPIEAVDQFVGAHAVSFLTVV